MAARILVAYATKYGSTAEIADAIGGVLREAGHDVDVLPVGDVVDVAPYRAVIVGSALYSATWLRDANRFVARHHEALRARPVWLFSSGPLDRSADGGRLPIARHVTEATDRVGARGHRTFGGRLLPGTPGLDERTLATHPNGDFRDWADIRAWALEIAASLGEG